MFHTDRSIESKSEDKLNRKSFAENLGQAILSYKEIDSIVLGFYGEWGSGKTSTINMILEYIENNNIPEESKPIIIKFNPWLFIDQKQLINEFFKQLSVVLRRGDYGADAKSVGEMLETYSKFFIPLTFIEPVTATVVSQVFEKVGLAARSWRDLKKNDLNAIRDELNKLLKKQTRKIFIVIDDIDRLNNNEIRQIFQLVKSAADFPNTLYLLAFDRSIVANALKEVQQGSGDEYLEKIIQIPFTLPEISHLEIGTVLIDKINKVLGDIPENEFDNTYFGNIYQSGLKYYFNNIRDVNRYINLLSFNYSLTKDEVNPVDLMAITAIQVFMPDAYNKIKSNKEVFTGIIVRYGLSQEQLKSVCDEIINQANINFQPHFKEFLLRLFPKLEGVYGNKTYVESFLTTWRKNKRICSADNFEIYFRLSLPQGRFSQKEMRSILAQADNIDIFKETLLKLNKENRIIQFLEQVNDYIDNTPKSNVENIIAVFMDIRDLLPEGDEGFFSININMRIVWISHALSKKYENQEERFNLFKNIFDKITNSLYSIVYEVGWQEQEHEKRPDDEHILNNAQLVELKGIVCQRIKQWANNGNLAKDKHLVRILFSWKKWGKIEDIIAFVNNLVSTDEGLIQLIQGFIFNVQSQSVDDYVIKNKKQIKLENIKEFLDIDPIQSKLKTIHSSEKYTQFNKEQQETIQIFLDTYDGKNQDDW